MILEVAHHSGSKVYLNTQHVVMVRRQENGDTEITMVAGPPLAVKDDMSQVLATLGYEAPASRLIDYKEDKGKAKK